MERWQVTYYLAKGKNVWEWDSKLKNWVIHIAERNMTRKDYELFGLRDLTTPMECLAV
jgi:hypothetical protein